MSGVLDAILASKAREVEALRARPSEAQGRARARARDVAQTLGRAPGAPLRLIAEIKRRSPSAGPLSTALSPGARAVAYARAGASMVSVLCDAPFFDGAWEHLEEARAALDREGLSAVPLLAKEFVIDEAQIDEAAARGADAVLLIVRIVPPGGLGRLVSAARARGLEPLVEVVTDEELARALEAGAHVVGVNARDLDTLAMDAARAARVLAAIPPSCVAVHLSGLKGPDDVATVARSRADAALIGEALMRVDDPSDLVASMVRAAGPSSRQPANLTA